MSGSRGNNIDAHSGLSVGANKLPDEWKRVELNSTRDELNPEPRTPKPAQPGAFEQLSADSKNGP